jgi:imidazolonepropionase-like amidohydrolase
VDLILRNSRIEGATDPRDIGIDKGRIVAIEPSLAADGEQIDLAGRLVTHLHPCGSGSPRALTRSAALKPMDDPYGAFVTENQIAVRRSGSGPTARQTVRRWRSPGGDLMPIDLAIGRMPGVKP